MFDFQKEVVINDANDFALVGDGDSKVFRVHDGGNYKKDFIVDGTYYRTEACVGKAFALTIDAKALVGKHVQVVVELGLDNDYRGDYSSAVWYYRKPMVVDVLLPEADAAVVLAAALKAVVPPAYKFALVSKDGDNVVVKGADSYQKVRSVLIEEIENDIDDPKVVVKADHAALIAGGLDVVSYERNHTEFGTYDYLLHNLRLPTYENLRFNSPAAVEMPVKGGKYTQFSFAYTVPRVGLGGLSAAGQVIQSTTIHTFYVLSTIADAFAEGLGAVAKEKSVSGDSDKHEHLVKAISDSEAASADLTE